MDNIVVTPTMTIRFEAEWLENGPDPIPSLLRQVADYLETHGNPPVWDIRWEEDLRDKDDQIFEYIILTINQNDFQSDYPDGNYYDTSKDEDCFLCWGGKDCPACLEENNDSQ